MLPRPIKIGDIVKLRCGGPEMTVKSLGSSAIDCLWFDRDSQVREYAFPIELLLIREGGSNDERD